MNNPATTDGLIGRGLIIGDDAGQTPSVVAEFRLGEAWRSLQAEMRRIPVDLAAAVAAGSITIEDIADVVCQAAMRVLRNPDGATEESAAIDDYRESRKVSDPSQDIYFTAAEIRRLTPLTAVQIPNAGSLKYL